MSNVIPTRQERRKRAILFRPTGHRYEEIKINNETDNAAIGLLEDQEYRVWKHAPAWSGDRDTLFLAVDGSPVTAVIDEDKSERWVTIKQFLEEIWTVEVVSKLPPQLADPLRIKWGASMTVAPAEIDPEAKVALNKLKANEMLHESNLKEAQDYGKATEEVSRTERIIEFLMHAVIGAGIMYFVVKQGII